MRNETRGSEMKHHEMRDYTGRHQPYFHHHKHSQEWLSSNLPSRPACSARLALSQGSCHVLQLISPLIQIISLLGHLRGRPGGDKMATTAVYSPHSCLSVERDVFPNYQMDTLLRRRIGVKSTERWRDKPEHLGGNYSCCLR